MKIIFIFSCFGMFRDVPACSGMFHVPGFIDALKLERSKEVKTRFLNIQPSLSVMELPLRFIFALNIMQVNEERNHSTVNPNTKARY